jgi:hypothetical protein
MSGAEVKINGTILILPIDLHGVVLNYGSQDNSLGTATRLQAGWPGFNSQQWQEFISSP